jgi:hypothetical protein
MGYSSGNCSSARLGHNLALLVLLLLGLCTQLSRAYRVMKSGADVPEGTYLQPGDKVRAFIFALAHISPHLHTATHCYCYSLLTATYYYPLLHTATATHCTASHCYLLLRPATHCYRYLPALPTGTRFLPAAARSLPASIHSLLRFYPLRWLPRCP